MDFLKKYWWIGLIIIILIVGRHQINDFFVIMTGKSGIGTKFYGKNPPKLTNGLFWQKDLNNKYWIIVDPNTVTDTDSGNDTT